MTSEAMTAAITLPVADAYDRWAPHYDDQDNPMVAAAIRVLPLVCGAVTGQAIVEFGCGTGRNLQMFQNAGAGALTGLDVSAGMLALAAARVPSAQFLQHDMAHPTAMTAASVDLALFCLTMEHAGDLTAPLAEAKRLLRPSGRVVVVEIHPFIAQSGVAAHFWSDGQEVRMPTFPHRFSDYINSFAAAGLHLQHCRDWCPADLGPDLTDRALKRGATTPLIVSFTATGL